MSDNNDKKEDGKPMNDQSNLDEAEIRKNEIDQLNQYIKERNERLKWKLELKQKNQNADSLRLDENFLKKLDSSIKKVTSFIKKIKVLTESQKDALAKEMQQLNLTKYLSEVVSAFLEAKLKMNDIPCALHLCSILHQNYSEFSSMMFEQWQKLLNLKKDDKVTNPSKMRVDLRFFAELITIGVLPEKEALSLLGNQLTVLTICDKEHANISIISSFCKHCGEDFADLVPTKYINLSNKHFIIIPNNTIYSADRQKAVRSLFKEYFKTLIQHVFNDHKEIQKIERQNKKNYQTKGELNADKKEKYEQSINAYKKLLENTEVFSELLGETMPELPVEEIKKEDDLLVIDIYMPGKDDEFDSSTSPWEDEETRQFYECIPDLQALVPGILYKDSEKGGQTKQANEEPTKDDKVEGETIGKENDPIVDIAVQMEQIEKELKELEDQSSSEAASIDINPISEDQAELIIYDEDESGQNSNLTAISNSNNPSSANLASTANTNNLANANMKILMDAYIAQLPNCVNRELIDKAAKEFLTNMNTKTNRKRLVGALFQVQRTRLDLLPFYSRFVAILNPFMPELSTDLSSLLLNDFRFHVRKKDQINIESKIKTARFIGELVKFKMFGKAEAVNCLKTLLADFRHHNIEMFCNLLDCAGRYLYRNQETHMKLRLLLEILMRKKQAMSLDGRYTIMIENAFYYCNPPENKQIEKKVLNPLHEYIKKLLYKDLNKLCVEKVLRQMRKLNWNDEATKQYAVKSLIAIWNVKYNTVHCMANLVSGLALYHDDVGIQVVDGVIEDIRLGLEINQPKFNQRRISMVKYLGELYNYRMVESSIIFKTLYTLITFGITDGSSESLDPVDNFFRVRLVCALLDTCGQYFDRGTTKKKLDCFLIYFQRYYLYKKELTLEEDPSRSSYPMDVEFAYTETINTLRQNYKFFKTYKEASDEVEKMENEIKESLQKTAPQLIKEIEKKDQLVGSGDADQLGTIKEDEEDDELEEYDENNEIDEDNENRATKNYDDEDEDEESFNRNRDDENEDDQQRQRNDSYNQDQCTDSNSEMEDAAMIIQPRIVKQEMSKEDEEFMKAFDSLLTENIAQRTKDTIKMPHVDISIPMISKKIKTNASNIDEPPKPPINELKGLSFTKPAPPPPQEAIPETQAPKKFNFVVMTKKGTKTQYHNMEVPVTSEFANQFRAREEAERIEKEKLKQLTLNINERMVQEEFQNEMMQSGQYNKSYSGNSNRDRYQKYNHPRGAPDADAIFGSSSHQQNKRPVNETQKTNK